MSSPLDDFQNGIDIASALSSVSDAAEAFFDQQLSGQGTSQGNESTQQQQTQAQSAQQQAAVPAHTAAQPQQTAETPAQQQQGQAPTQPQTQQQQGKTPIPLQFADDDIIQLPNGQVVTGKDLREGGMRTADYTRKTQEAARLRQEAEQRLQQAQQAQQQTDFQAAWQAMATQPQEALGFIAQRYGPEAAQDFYNRYQQAVAQQAPAVDPNEIVTAEQAQQLIAGRVNETLQRLELLEQRMNARLEGRFEAERQYQRDLEQYSTHDKAIKGTISALVEAHPVLGDIPHAEDSLRYIVGKKVEQLREQGVKVTEADALRFFKEEGEALAKRIEARYVQQAKEAAVQQQALVANGIQPPGGTGVQPVPVDPNNVPQHADGRIDWNAIERNAMRFIDQQQAR